MNRRALACAVCAALVLVAPAAAGPGAASWALPQIKVVAAKGLMGGKVAAFRPDDAITRGELADLVTDLSGGPAPLPDDASAPATIAQLDAQLVRGLGLLPSARLFSAAIRDAGLTPTRYFGTEVVARLIGLRVNHPAGQDALELGPEDPATRAEAAYSAARILAFGDGETEFVEKLADGFRPQSLSGLQREILQTAVSLVGYPYVWAGTSERRPVGSDLPGGFDCSGFVWRVYKLEDYGADGLAATLKGRTTYAMSGEVGRAKRIPLGRLQPADLVFFGADGVDSKPAEVDHVGIYLGDGWFVHSSEQGVALAQVSSDWYAKRFAWGRRPLAEAGLD
ncbi:MAG TPA: C40 family peptidase [Gaiellaceae bacterium]|nr:C40 family peptidase [Gaiellaceae bacterium]